MRELSTLCEGSAFCEDARACIQERDGEIERLRLVIMRIANYCSGEDRNLGTFDRLVAIHNTAEQALRAVQQNGDKT